jgi:hypothetical protein
VALPQHTPSAGRSRDIFEDRRAIAAV